MDAAHISHILANLISQHVRTVLYAALYCLLSCCNALRSVRLAPTAPRLGIDWESIGIQEGFGVFTRSGHHVPLRRSRFLIKSCPVSNSCPRYSALIRSGSGLFDVHVEDAVMAVCGHLTFTSMKRKKETKEMEKNNLRTFHFGFTGPYQSSFYAII